MSSVVTLLWFGAEAYALHGADLLPIPLPDKGDPATTIAEAVAKLEPRPKTVQLIYQPAGLDPLRAACTRGSRAVLAKVLANEHPAVAHPSAMWAALTPQAFEGSYTTMLFIDARPRIPRLQAALAEHSIAMRGAWPLPALLETIPPFSSGSEPGIFLVTTETTGLVYAILPNASRSLSLVGDVAARDNALLSLNTALTYFEHDVPPPVHVIALGEPWPLGDNFAEITPTAHDLPSLLQRASALPTSGTSNFAPPEFAFPWNRLLQLASVLMIAFALISGFIYYRDLRALQADQTRRAALADDVRKQVTTLRANREQIYAARAFGAEVPESQRQMGRLFDTLVKATPTAITLHSLTITDGTFTIEGTLHEGIGNQTGPFTTFYDVLSRADQPWTMSAQNRTIPTTADFLISGTFR